MLVAKEREREKVTQNDREWLLHCWEKTFQKHSKKDFVHFQCDQIWRNCATLVKFSVFGQCLEYLLNILNLFWHFLSNWALFDCCIWQNFEKIVKQSGHAVPIYSIFYSLSWKWEDHFEDRHYWSKMAPICSEKSQNWLKKDSSVLEKVQISWKILNSVQQRLSV